MAGIKKKYIETTNLLTDGLICLYWSQRGFNINLRMFHNQLKPLNYVSYKVLGHWKDIGLSEERGE